MAAFRTAGTMSALQGPLASTNSRGRGTPRGSVKSRNPRTAGAPGVERSAVRRTSPYNATSGSDSRHLKPSKPRPSSQQLKGKASPTRPTHLSYSESCGQDSRPAAGGLAEPSDSGQSNLQAAHARSLSNGMSFLPLPTDWKIHIVTSYLPSRP